MQNVDDPSLVRWLSTGSRSTTGCQPRFLRTVSSPLQGKYSLLSKKMSFLSGRSASIVLRWNDAIEEEGEFDMKIGVSERPPTEISDLPDRCIVAIMANVVKAEDWIRYKLVSHRWCRLANQALQALNFRQSGSHIPSILGSLRTFVNLTSLQLHFSTPGALTDSLLEQMGRTCPQVLSLNVLYPESWRTGVADVSDLPEASDGRVSSTDKTLSKSMSPVTAAGFDGLFKGCQHLMELTVAATSLHQRGEVTDPFHMPSSISNLKHLSALAFHIRGCASLPNDFGCLQSLEELSFGSEELLELPDSFGDLYNLTSLDLSGCTKLKHLPESLGHLSSLTSLRLKDCRELDYLPLSTGGLISLSQLNCQDCYMLEELPESIGSLGSLTSLDLSGCLSLTALPESFCELSCLRRFDVSNCPALTIGPETMEHLVNLRPSDMWKLMAFSLHQFPPPQVR